VRFITRRREEAVEAGSRDAKLRDGNTPYERRESASDTARGSWLWPGL
jgi:hypothetical protein